jgi:hypothetical protein
MKWYGNVTNRLEEGRTVPEIIDGMDITMYHWSDRTCYWVEHVENQKRIIVGEYYVCADHSKPGGMGHQNWMYFKTLKDENEYLEKYFPGTRTGSENDKPALETWVYRYNKWMQEVTYTDEHHCSEKELKSLKKNGYYKRYYNLGGKISFGRRDYYYDWEF